MDHSMGSFDCVVLNGRVVTAADIGQRDIGIKDGKIAMLALRSSLAKAKADRVIDAEGAFVAVCSSPHTCVMPGPGINRIIPIQARRSRRPRTSRRARTLRQRQTSR